MSTKEGQIREILDRIKTDWEATTMPMSKAFSMDLENKMAEATKQLLSITKLPLGDIEKPLGLTVVHTPCIAITDKHGVLIDVKHLEALCNFLND